MAEALSKPYLGRGSFQGCWAWLIITSTVVNQQSPVGESHPWVAQWQDRNAHKGTSSDQF